MYKLIAIIGEAGSGKDTVLHQVMSADQQHMFHSPVSCTTRPPRDYEKDGVDYHFLTAEEFAKKVLNNDFLEVADFNNWFYGTLKEDLSKDKINIAVLNPEGIDSIILHKDIELVIVYLECKGKIRLIRQLQREEDPDICEIFRRYLADDEDFNNLPWPHEVLVNESSFDLANNTAWILRLAENWTKEDR